VFELTGFQRDLLWVIAALDRPSGQEVMAKFSEYVESINHGRLYPNLDALADRGLVNKGQRNRRTNYYEISDEGLELLEERRQWEKALVDLEVDEPSE
jgi:DNA-binding PadR family transcriptional regulator